MSKAITFPAHEWFLETSFPGVRRCKADAFRIRRRIYKGKTSFQDIEIFESPGFGVMLALDGIIQLSQSDEYIYHEVITHTPLLAHPDPRTMLVVGGGDGGVLREARKHPLKEIVFVDIDRQVVEICRKHLAFISKGAFRDPRVKVFFEDGIQLIRRYPRSFDVVVVDSTDPVGPGKVLFALDFYRLVKQSLKPAGMAIFQLGPFLDFDLIIRPTAQKLRKLFRFVHPVRLCMPSYSCGCEYCFMIASSTVDPARIPVPVLARRLKARLGLEAQRLRYLTPQTLAASMAMPKVWQV